MSQKSSAQPEVRLVLLSGPVAVGKTTVARALERDHQFLLLSTRGLIEAMEPPGPRTRLALQLTGERLDVETRGRWVADSLPSAISGIPEPIRMVVDAVRTHEQVKAVKDSVAGRVVHVHLTAPKGVLEERFRSKHSDGLIEPEHYSHVRANQTERAVDGLASEADLVIDTSMATTTSAISLILRELGYRPAFEAPAP